MWTNVGRYCIIRRYQIPGMYYVPNLGVSSISAGLMQNVCDDSHFSAEAPIDRSPATTQQRVKYLKKTNVQGRTGAVSTFSSRDVGAIILLQTLR